MYKTWVKIFTTVQHRTSKRNYTDKHARQNDPTQEPLKDKLKQFMIMDCVGCALPVAPQLPPATDFACEVQQERCHQRWWRTWTHRHS